MESSLSGRRVVLIVILTLAAAPYFMRLGASSLWDSNEAFYAETPREMIESGDYTNPSFNYQPRFNKPPLCYWVVVAFYKVFGVSEAAERLAIALAALVMIATAYELGRLTFSVEAGLLAGIGLAAAPRFLMFSRRIMIDVYLAMFMALALLLFILSERQPKRRRLYLIAMYAAIGLGVLTKGPVAAVLPAFAFLTYLAVYRRLKQIRDLMLPTGVAIIALIVLPWYVAIYAQHGWSHIQTFILKDNLSRYAEQVWGPSRGPLFYIGVIAGDFFPWSLFVVPALWCEARYGLGFTRGSSRKKSEPSIEAANNPASLAATQSTLDPHTALLIIWIAVIVIFFSLSKSKEDLYILPIYPAAAALVGKLLTRWLSEKDSSRYVLVLPAALILGAVLVVVGIGVLYIFASGAQAYELSGATAIGSIALAGGLVTSAAAAAKKSLAAVLGSVFAVIVFNWVFVLRTLPDFERYKPVRALCELISSRPPDALAGYYRLASPSMTFYLRGPIFEYYSREEIDSAFGSGKDVYCMMTAADYESLKPQLGAPTYVLASLPMFQVKLKGLLDKVELPQVVLISNADGATIAK